MNKNFERILEHVNKAVEKHPKFCTSFCGRINDTIAEQKLELARTLRRVDPNAYHILNEEVCEVLDAYSKGETEHAIDECYDAIAVLLRMVEFIQEETK